MNIKITGTGSCIPNVNKKNEDFLTSNFLNTNGTAFKQNNDIIIQKFKAITGIEERRYAEPNQVTSDLGFIAAEKAIIAANINPETLDYIIVASNYGDVKSGNIQCDTVPSMASRIKHKLGIKNPNCVAYDLLFGCPGWVQAIIHASAFMKSGMSKKCLVIGAETLSRVVDDYDRDSMIYSDGAGATILEISDNEKGILSHESASYTFSESEYIFFGETYDPSSNSDTRYIKMNGRKIYEFALTNVPLAMKSCLDKSGTNIKDLKKVFIHQANEKMDEAILERFYKLYNSEMPNDIMPMCINELGNSSVATIPTLFDLVVKDNYKNHNLKKGDIIMFASVGAGMNINAITYQY
ncbi:3-oxoacyl-ACP synthase III family protein [Flavobacteriaceae bacterium]|nr:3-oxoacyl-ACP synthase III family protein [Flavobacteriaceae bacterium]